MTVDIKNLNVYSNMKQHIEQIQEMYFILFIVISADIVSQRNSKFYPAVQDI